MPANITDPNHSLTLKTGMANAAQAAQGPIQPGLEHLQGWGTHSSGQQCQHLTAL